MMITQAVVKKVTLPIHVVLTRYKPLPVFHRRFHSRIARKCQDSVPMVRHEQRQAAMPNQLVVVVFDGGEHRVARVRAAQLVLPRRHAFDRDEEPTPIGDPLRNCMRKLFSNGQIQACSVSSVVQLGKPESKVGRVTPCAPQSRYGKRRARSDAPYLRTDEGAPGVTRPTRKRFTPVTAFQWSLLQIRDIPLTCQF